MIEYMSIEEQVDADFARARRKATLRRLTTRLLRRDPTSGGLFCFEEVRRRLGATGGIPRGRSVVSLTSIVGSVGRCSQFDGAFLPANNSSKMKWERIDWAFHRGQDLPPVILYKIGDSYFVHDGNHRVSVARFHGVEWIDAEVTEFRSGRIRRGNAVHIVDLTDPVRGDDPRSFQGRDLGVGVSFLVVNAPPGTESR